MESPVLRARALPDYRLRLDFVNGSSAVVDLRRRVRTLRFHPLRDPAAFSRVRVEGDRLAWPDGEGEFRVFVSELLETMLMD